MAQFKEIEQKVVWVEKWVELPDPEGLVCHQVVSHYFGSHEERGDGDEIHYLALPKGVSPPHLSHGTHSDFRDHNREILLALPKGSLIWDDDCWRTPEDFYNQ